MALTRGHFKSYLTEEEERTGLVGRIAADFTTGAWAILPLGIGLNVVGALLAKFLNLPLYLDTVGTILIALLLGPWVGAFAGLLSNLILGVLKSPVSIPYALNSMAIGLVVGYLGYAGWFKGYARQLGAALAITAVAMLVTAPITAYVFGGDGNQRV